MRLNAKTIGRFFVFFILLAAGSAAANAETLVISDFDTGSPPNNLGGDFGSWDKDPFDDTQMAEMTFESDDALGDPSGYAIRLDYDVDSPNPAYNGLWMKFNGFDATDFNQIGFYVRGDRNQGYTPKIKIELKDYAGKSSSYIYEGITDEWERVKIPFHKFPKIEAWNKLNEIVIVFDDMSSDPKVGAIYIDHMFFTDR